MATSENTERSPGNAVTPIYCVKCKTKTNNSAVEPVVMKNGRPATKATCADCGTGKYRIGG